VPHLRHAFVKDDLTPRLLILVKSVEVFDDCGKTAAASPAASDHESGSTQHGRDNDDWPYAPSPEARSRPFVHLTPSLDDGSPTQLYLNMPSYSRAMSIIWVGQYIVILVGVGGARALAVQAQGAPEPPSGLVVLDHQMGGCTFGHSPWLQPVP
jgi:hypothetical protein